MQWMGAPRLGQGEVVECSQETQVEALLYVAQYAFEKKTAKEEMPWMPQGRPELKGEFSRDEQSVLARFPKLTAKFWKRCLEEFA